MEIKAIAKTQDTLIAVLIAEDGGDERIFWISAPADIRDGFADQIAAWIVQQRLQVEKS